MSGISMDSVFADFRDMASGVGSLSTIFVGAVICVVMILDLQQLVFIVIGAGAYATMQSLQSMTWHAPAKARPKKMAAGDTAPATDFGAHAPSPVVWAGAGAARDAARDAARRERRESAGGNGKASTPPWRSRAVSSPVTWPEATSARQTPPRGGVASQEGGCDFEAPRTSKPATGAGRSLSVARPPSQRDGWDAEVEGLLEDIAPTRESDRVVERLALSVRRNICCTIPEAEVVGFTSGNLTRGKAFGVAVPDVDIVINVSPNVLAARLQGRFAQGGRVSTTKLDARKLQKSAIRIFTDRLVSTGGFKFRRSSFRDQEPKVTLLAPASLGVFEEAVPVGISVNAVTPLYSAALLTECGHLDRRAWALVLLVKRWAKDRGVCHAAKGHLSPYLWSLLAIYFLQVGAEEGAILPPLEEFQVSSSLVAGSSRDERKAISLAAAQESALARKRSWRPTNPSVRKSAGGLFKDFFRFYCSSFDWENEAVSVRLGKREEPDNALPLHIVVGRDGRPETGPTIEDPFEEGVNLGCCLTAATLERLRQELARADHLCKAGSFAELLEQWVPPEQEECDAVGERRNSPDSHTDLSSEDASSACSRRSMRRVW